MLETAEIVRRRYVARTVSDPPRGETDAVYAPDWSPRGGFDTVT